MIRVAGDLLMEYKVELGEAVVLGVLTRVLLVDSARLEESGGGIGFCCCGCDISKDKDGGVGELAIFDKD